MIELFLPIPVSVNQLTHNNKAKGKYGRSKTKKAKDWYRDAQAHAAPFMRHYAKICNYNLNTRNRYWNFGKKAVDLHHLQEDHADLSYGVTYNYFFDKPRTSLPRDVFNFEKQLSDFLCDMGFMLDDCFIDEGRVKRMPHDPKNPRVEILIEILDRNI